MNARQAVTYYLRSLGAGVLLLACILFGDRNVTLATSGRELFAYLQTILFWSIWLCVPMLAADCLSREKREKTLGLLFLTHLSPTDLVIAKGLAHGLRAVTIGLAAVPVLTIPSLMGGIGSKEILLVVTTDFSAICLALAAGLLASACSRTWVRAIASAVIFAAIFVTAASILTGMLVKAWGLVPFGNEIPAGIAGLAVFLNVRGAWEGLSRFVKVPQLLWFCSLCSCGSVLLLALSVRLAGGKTRGSWQELPPSAFAQWMERVFCTPRFLLPLLHWWLSRKLEKNPVGWLEQRRWTGRLVVWSWFAVVISIYSAVLTEHTVLRGFEKGHEFISWLLLLSIAVTSAGSFRRERESGCLELLLISPLGEAEIMSGRLRGIYSQFFPAAGLLAFLWIYLSTLSLYSTHPVLTGPFAFQVISFFAVPVIGLYFSLRCRGFITAFLLTVAFGLVFPQVARLLLWGMLLANGFPPVSASRQIDGVLAPLLCQLLVAAACLRGLFHRLRRREFAVHRSGG